MVDKVMDIDTQKIPCPTISGIIILIIFFSYYLLEYFIFFYFQSMLAFHTLYFLAFHYLYYFTDITSYSKEHTDADINYSDFIFIFRAVIPCRAGTIICREATPA